MDGLKHVRALDNHNGVELINRSNDVSDSLSPRAPRIVLAVAITCALISLVAAFFTCWWFARMKRTFRHHLIMLLIVSDMCKAVWFFVFPLIVLVSGPVSSSSSFCQVSGFFLAQATEASDFAALMLALHLVSCVFRPPKRDFQGGLYRFRRWIHLLWACLPIVAASLAFTNAGNAYVSYGAFCYLPEQPVWYRMALAWIPRYVVFVTIFSVAFIVTIHVHIKFKRFSHLGDEAVAGHLGSEGASIAPKVPNNHDSPLPLESQQPSSENAKPSTLTIWQNPFHSGNLSVRHIASGNELKIVEVNLPTPETGGEISRVPHRGTGVRDFALYPPSGSYNHPTNLSEPREQSSEPSTQTPRTVSVTPSFATDVTDDMEDNCFRAPSSGTDSATEELLTHRHTIERHLRILFLYPVSYMLVWTLPFVSQCLQLTGTHFENQSLWLQLLVTGVLALQASVDAAVFSYRERPWKRARGRPLISKVKLQRLKLWRPSPSALENGVGTKNGKCQEPGDQNVGRVSPKGLPCWWEEEGKKRRDSVWMGTDTLTLAKSRQQPDEEAIEEDKDPLSPDIR
jgi:G protein-coupled receptor GPR1